MPSGDRDQQVGRAGAFLEQALGAVARGFHAGGLYSMKHPAVLEAAGVAAKALGGAIREDPRLVVSVAGGSFLYQDQTLEGGDLGGLAERLHRQEVAAIEFVSRVDGAGFEALIGALLAGDHERLGGAGLVERVHEMTGGAVRLVPLSYGSLRVASGVRVAGDGGDGGDEGARVSWADLVCGLLGGGGAGAGGGEMSGEQLAAAFNRAHGEGGVEGGGCSSERLGAVHGQLCSMLASAQAMGEAEKAETLDRLRAFVGEVDPKLRGALMRADSADPGGSLSLLAEMADVLPVGEVLSALEKMDRPGGDGAAGGAEGGSGGVSGGGGKVSSDAVRLFKKLGRLTEGDASEKARAATAAQRWEGDGSGVAGGIEGSLQELLEMHGSDEFSPDDYQARLDGIANDVAGEGGGLVGGVDFAKQMDLSDARVHSVQIALQIAGEQGSGVNGQDPGPELFGYIAEALDDLIERRRFDMILSGVRAAQGALAGMGERETREAAGGLVEALSAEGRIGRIAKAGCVMGGVAPNVEAVLKLSGERGLGQIMDLLGTPLDGAVRGLLESVVRGCSGSQLDRVIKGLGGEGQDSMHAVFAVAKMVGVERGLGMIEPMLKHERGEVRVRAYQTLGELTEDWPGEWLRAGLGDEDEAVQGVVVDRLAGADDPESIQLMGAFLEGTLSGRLAGAELFTRVVRLLGDRGEAGVVRLCDALKFLGRRPNPRNVVLATRLVGVLGEYRERREVKRALGRWRVSPAHLLSIVLLGGGKGAEVSG